VKDTITTILIIANKKSVILNKQSHLSQMAFVFIRMGKSVNVSELKCIISIQL